MADFQQKLILLAELLGDKQVLDGLQRMTAAQEKVGLSAEQAGEAAQESGKKTEEQTLAFRDFANILGLIDPRLQSMAGRLFRAAESFGNIGTKAIDFGAAGKGLVETLGKLGPALGLLAAGGAVALGIGAIGTAMAKMREETAKATEELERQREAMNDIRRQQSDRQQAIEGISDARRRGGFPADTSRLAQSTAELIKRRNPQLEDSAINQAIGNLFDVTQDPAELAEAAFLLQNDDRFKFTGRESAGRAEIKFRQAQRRNAGRFQQFQRRENRQDLEMLDRVRNELRADRGSTVAIEEFIRRFVEPGLPDEEVAELIKRVDELQNVEGLIEAYTQRYTSGVMGNVTTRRLPIDKPVDARAQRFFNTLDHLERMKKAEDEERAKSDPHGRIDTMLRDREMNNTPAGTAPPAKPSGPPVSTTINNYNSRNYGAFAMGQRSAIRNGESLAARMEMV